MKISLVCLFFCHALLLRRSGANGTSISTASGNTEKQITDGVYLGCFSNSCIKFVYHVDVPDNQTTPELCTTSCKDNGYALAGVYNRTKCSCTCEKTCNKPLDESKCGLPCRADQSKFCGSYVAVSLYNVNSNVSFNCSEVSTSPAQTTHDPVSFMLEPLNIIYFSFTGAAFVVVIIVVIVRTRRRGQHDFDRAFQHHLQSNRTEGTIHYSTQDMIDYPYDSLIRGPCLLPPTQRRDALPMTACGLGSHTNSRRRRSCDADDDHWHDHGGRCNDSAPSGSNLYFSIIAEEDEKEEEVEEKGKAMKGQVGGGCCSTRAPPSSTDGAYAYADCHVGNNDYQRGVVKSIPNEDYK